MAREERTEELQKMIVEWLKSESASEIRTDHKTGGGFSVFEKDRLETEDGFLTVTDYLKSRNFAHNMTVGGYRVVYQDGGRQYPESFAFFPVKTAVKVPKF